MITYGFLHGSWWHVGLNAMFLLLVGSRIEHMAGRAVLVKADHFRGARRRRSGILLWLRAGAGAPLLVGFSGGCIGLLLLLTTLSPQSRMMPIPISGKSLGLGILMAELILALIDPALGVPGFSDVGKMAGRSRTGAAGSKWATPATSAVAWRVGSSGAGCCGRGFRWNASAAIGSGGRRRSRSRSG